MMEAFRRIGEVARIAVEVEPFPLPDEDMGAGGKSLIDENVAYATHLTVVVPATVAKVTFSAGRFHARPSLFPLNPGVVRAFG